MDADELTDAQLHACRVLAHQFGGPVDVWPEQPWGRSTVVGVRLSNGDDVVLKASGDHSIVAEANTFRLAAAAGVPVPPILAEGEDRDLPGGRWMVLRKARGRPWALPDRTADASPQTQADVGELYAHLHACKPAGYGPLTEDGAGGYLRWSDWLIESMSGPLDFLGSGRHYDPELVTRVRRLFSSRAAMLDERPGVLVHGDLGNMEIFIDENDRVVDIVDFGSSVVGDPVYEFARFCGGGPVDDRRPAALLPGTRRSYVEHGGIEPDNWDELYCIYSIYNAVENCAWSVREGYPWLTGLRSKVGHLLDLLDEHH